MTVTACIISVPLRLPDQFTREGSQVFRISPRAERSLVKRAASLAERYMKDAENASVSNETRLSAAYDAMLNFALVALSAEKIPHHISKTAYPEATHLGKTASR